jgi:hypothetical protein
MAKAFYTQDEAKAALATDDDGLKNFVHEGKLTEYRDGAQLMYKGSQVEALSQEAGDDIGLSDTGGPISLADSAGGSAGGIALSDEPAGEQPPQDSAAPALAADDTGSFSLADSTSGTAAGQSGITIFEDDDVDPNSQTSIGAGGSSDQVNLEGIGSGSGLLDLTQEPDDTSFGAETFDEIMPEGSVAGGTVAGLDTDDDGVIDTAVAPAGTRAVGVVYEPDDPQAPLIAGLAAGTVVVVLMGMLALGLAATGAGPGFLGFMFTDPDAGPLELNLGVFLAVAVGLPILGLIGGFIGGKLASN